MVTLGSMGTYRLAEGAPLAGKPRVFIPFEDRKRDLTGLLEFGTVVQVFTSDSPWQVREGAGVEAAIAAFFATVDFTDNDAIACLGDPVAVAVMVANAAKINKGRVRVLRWDRIPCDTCHTYRRTCSRSDCPGIVKGRYVPVQLSI